MWLSWSKLLGKHKNGIKLLVGPGVLELLIKNEKKNVVVINNTRAAWLTQDRTDILRSFSQDNLLQDAYIIFFKKMLIV